jgi:hypothetical protein
MMEYPWVGYTGLALAAAGLLLGWGTMPRGPAEAPAFADPTMAPGSPDLGEAVRPPATWTAVDRDDDWSCDLFTPPLIRRDETTGAFYVPSRRAPDPVLASEPDLQLLAVLQPVFRVQLVGYVGQAEQWLGVFEDVVSGRTQLARAGQTLAGLDVRVVAVRVERELEGPPELSRWVAAADVVDGPTGSTIRLTSEDRRAAAPARARLRLRSTGQEWEQDVGSEHVVGRDVVRLHALELGTGRAQVVIAPSSTSSASASNLARTVTLSHEVTSP